MFRRIIIYTLDHHSRRVYVPPAAGVKPGQRISVQVPVYAEDENPDASSEEPRKLAKKNDRFHCC